MVEVGQVEAWTLQVLLCNVEEACVAGCKLESDISCYSFAGNLMSKLQRHLEIFLGCSDDAQNTTRNPPCKEVTGDVKTILLEE
ncbi:hypothetical protein F444_19666 [Phytophthora nicotianae P1976]|uniref:Uncharacterized protein n=1 Tax=Phytophthora nicotianae P1976 TaxID=1317066 RepID=A0A080Z716_PHYNI|nr:hypothetical protein F444_19666 [Phytophthora nicotianae P1976]